MSVLSVIGLAILLALGPTLLYAMVVWWLDRHEKEPLSLLLVAFVWGAVPAVIMALVFELAAGLSLRGLVMAGQAREITEASVVAPLVEEGLKAVVLVVLFLAYSREFDNVLDGIIYGAMVGLGFAFVENVLYFSFAAYGEQIGVGEPHVDRMVGLWFFRAGLFGLNHSMFTAFTGAALGLARSLKSGALRGFVASLGLGAAMIFHALHNALTTAVSVLSLNETRQGLVVGACLGIFVSDWGGLLLILVVALISGARETQIIKQTLWEEVALGRFTPDEYATLVSGRKRWSVRWSVLFSSGFRRWVQTGRFFDLATELAFRKHHLEEGDPVSSALSARDITGLRDEIDSFKKSFVFSQ